MAITNAETSTKLQVTSGVFARAQSVLFRLACKKGKLLAATMRMQYKQVMSGSNNAIALPAVYTEQQGGCTSFLHIWVRHGDEADHDIIDGHSCAHHDQSLLCRDICLTGHASIYVLCLLYVYTVFDTSDRIAIRRQCLQCVTVEVI